MNKENMKFPELNDNELEMTAGGARRLEDMITEIMIHMMKNALQNKEMHNTMKKEIYKDILENTIGGNGSDNSSGM